MKQFIVMLIMGLFMSVGYSSQASIGGDGGCPCCKSNKCCTQGEKCTAKDCCKTGASADCCKGKTCCGEGASCCKPGEEGKDCCKTKKGKNKKECCTK